MCNKLSHDSMRTKHIDSLVALRNRTEDTHKVNNYLSTMKQIIVKCKVEIENMIDVNQCDEASTEDGDQASVYPAQAHGHGRGYRGQFGQRRGEYNGHRGNQGGYYNKHRGGQRGYQNHYRGNHGNHDRPINMDDRGNLIWDYYGKPVDLTKDEDKGFE